MNAAARTKALVLAAGLGTRLRPLTDSVPKCLVDIHGRPLLDYWFDALRDAGISEVLVNTHHLRGAVQHFLAEKRRQGFNAIEAFEPKLLGSAGTISANAEWAGGADEVIIIYSDNFSDVSLRDFVEFHRAGSDPVTMLLFRAPNPKACGIAELDDSGRVIAFEEKPAFPRSDLANAGLYVLSAAAWREIAAMRAFDIGFDVLPRFIGRMRGFLHRGEHRDIGDMDALLRARNAAAAMLRRTRQQTHQKG
jgi:mannose-1-phosphate guanylyltransferase